MSWAEERRADRIAEREQDRIDRREREELARQRREEEDERKRQADQDKEAKRKKAKATRRAARARVWGKVVGNLDTTLAVVAMACSVGPAFYFQLVAMVHAGAPLLIALALAVMLESGAQVATISGEKAKREGRPVAPHRIAMWGCATVASAINALKAPSMFPGAAWMVAVLALSSYGGVAFWELRSLGRHKGKSARTKQQRAEEKKRQQHEKKRRKAKDVWARHEEILAAHPYGTITPEHAWAQAWEDVKSAPLGQTAEVLKRRLAARREVEKVLADAERSPESIAVDALLADLFPAHGKGDDGQGGTPLRDPSGKPPAGDSEGATALGRKGKQGSGRTSQKTPEKPLDPAHLEIVRDIAERLGGASKLSHAIVRNAVGGGSNEYLVRLRRAVQNGGEEQ